MGSYIAIPTLVSLAARHLSFLYPGMRPCDRLDGRHPVSDITGPEQAAERGLGPRVVFLLEKETFHTQRLKP